MTCDASLNRSTGRIWIWYRVTKKITDRNLTIKLSPVIISRLVPLFTWCGHLHARCNLLYLISSELLKNIPCGVLCEGSLWIKSSVFTSIYVKMGTLVPYFQLTKTMCKSAPIYSYSTFLWSALTLWWLNVEHSFYDDYELQWHGSVAIILKHIVSSIPFLLIFIPACISNYIHYEVWDEIQRLHRWSLGLDK